MSPPPKNSHHVVILLEPMGFEARRRAISATETFLQGLSGQGGYRVALVDGPRLVQPFTSDIAAVVRALIDKVATKGNPGRTDGRGPWLRPSIALLDALALQQGVKSMVRFVDYGMPTGRDFLVPLAQRSNVAVYPVDARGLSVVVPFGDASTEAGSGVGSGLSPTEAGPLVAADIMARSSALFQESMILQSVAKATGGRAVTNNNDLGKIFRLVSDSVLGVYVVGYDMTPEMADGRWHTVRIRVNREELQVHAKEGYLAPRGPG